MAGLAGLDRKTMEEERLARLGRKRERSISPPGHRDARKAVKLETVDVDESVVSLPSGAMLKSFSTIVSDDQKGRKSATANAANQKMTNGHSNAETESSGNTAGAAHNNHSRLQYPNGAVKRTWAFGFERTGDDVKLEEVLEARTLHTAVLSAYQWNTDWVLSKLKVPPNGKTKLIFVMQAKEDDLRRQMIEQTENVRSYLRLCFPSMEGQINCMHSKLMLLFHPNKLRIAIPTANLLDFDWGETGVMENSVFMIDLPRHAERSAAKDRELNPFCSELLYFLEKQDIDKDVRDGVLNFDFSAADGIAFVYTAGGSNLGDEAGRTGFPGLSQAVRQLDLQTDEGLQIDFAASSIGSLSDDQLRNMHSAAQGVDMIKAASGAASKAQANFFKPKAGGPAASSAVKPKIRDMMRIYFPTHETVKASKAGAAGTICINRRWWEEMRFPRSCFRDYQSTRTGLLSHNKILYARGKQSDSKGPGKDVAWAYVGSANMSESAWGKLVYDKKAKSWKLNCRNWECGVLLPVSDEKIAQHTKQDRKTVVKQEKVAGDDSETESEDEAVTTHKTTTSKIVDIDVFDNLVKPPFLIPGKEYAGREPWYFQEQD
ncbi:uncharacterized protein LTR77_007456 [Saxophila tyrrhenica]|uniref:Phospholipase D/nuclease n=1 Tax=Saxophila tyrrhenica TaxID=1690608 RepID=A0AAV9P597_9PEZI|nr:hypothetical protein LTR77_007456 [Saxophila tyrrhenica]